MNRWEAQLIEQGQAERQKAINFALGSVSLQVPAPEMESLLHMWDTILRICGMPDTSVASLQNWDPDPHGPVGADLIFHPTLSCTSLGGYDNNTPNQNQEAHSPCALVIRVHFLVPFQKAALARLGALGVVI